MEGVTLISQCNEYDYYAGKIEENYMKAMTGDITLKDFEASTSATIDPVYDAYQTYFTDLEHRALVSTCQLAEDQMYKAVDASINLGVSNTTVWEPVLSTELLWIWHIINIKFGRIKK